ncbi:hypothetical protein [Nocardia sp. NPDC060259]|uniref:hypothetical protein n=1 Tax=Nocardia sp. NPDC060259 TaxID=3347088 RepID=UPI0036514BAC
MTRPDLPPAVDGVIARAMAKRRDERFGSATEFTDAIRDVLDGRHIAAPFGSYYETTVGAAAVGVLAAAVVACAASPSTRRWLRYRNALRTQRR